MAETYFPQVILNAIIGGTSGLDVPRLQLRSLEEAEGFLAAYGFPWSSPECRGELQQLLSEAWALIEEDLLVEGQHVPPPIRQESDPRRLLLIASSADDPLQPWACAVLRVSHTCAHATSPLEERHGHNIREQILQRFAPHLRTGPQGETSLGGEIPLVRFELKASKTKRSTVLKLLHKAENVAADVFDRIGVRFVTPTRLDALRVVRYLRVHHVIMFVNVKPTRSRNSLIAPEAIEALSHMSSSDIEALTDEDLPLPAAQPHQENRFSSGGYRSLQFTCRQMIRSGSERFFFPFEVQILDLESYEASRSGLASHEEYKTRQLRAVRRRVLGTLAG